MNKKVQSSTRLEKLAGVDADSKEKRKADSAPKPKSTEKSKPTEKAKASEKIKTTVTRENNKTEKKSKSSGKSAKSTQPAKKGVGSDEPHDQRKAVKTPQVLKLVERSTEVNPVLLAGKSRVPTALRGKQSLTKLMRRDLGEEFSDADNTIVVNITELAIEHEAPEILDRFNACSCDKCVEIFSRKIAERVPVRFARVNKDGRGTGNRELSERVAPMRKMVITEMIKELIVSKKRCFHDDAE